MFGAILMASSFGGCSGPGPGLEAPGGSVAILSGADPSGTSWMLPQMERLVFRVKWLSIPAGEIISEIKGVETLRGRPVYRIEVTARTTGICSALYRVEDRYVSYLDVERLHTLRHEVHRREGGYEKDAVTDFDQEGHVAHFVSATDGSEKTFSVPPDVQDTITAAYVARLREMAPGVSYEIPVCNSEKNYQVFLVASRRSSLRVPGVGEREVVLIRPYARLGTEEVKEGRMSGHIDAGPGHIPYLIVIKAPVFTKVTASLDPERSSFSVPGLSP
ncbi:MAG: DUF3108 domain-containing protein [Elusimicrobia bacterium]|nr:DUF3108 domain-containing protein [Elusimicrobiota bacterium]